MNVCLLSMFSSSTGYLDRYFYQVSLLRNVLQARGDRLRLILCEGDSVDQTWPQLKAQVRRYRLKHKLLRHHHGNTVYGSQEIPQRFAQLSRIWNEMLEHVTDGVDVVIIVESDLIWEAQTLLQLVEHAQAVGGIVAPMVFEGDDWFHDCWAHRRNGVRFTNEPPYHKDLASLPNGLLRMDSVGSCLAMPGEIARTCSTTESEELVGFCNQARAIGYGVWCDPRLRIQHPPTGQARRGVGTARPVRQVRVHSADGDGGGLGSVYGGAAR